MSEARKQSMAILAQVAEFLANLPEEQLDDLQSGAARLTLVPAGSNEPSPARASRARPTKESAPSADSVQVAEALTSVDTREAAAALLKPLKVSELNDVASILGIAITGKPAKAKLVTAIVERAVGNRLDSLAIRGTATLPY